MSTSTAQGRDRLLAPLALIPACQHREGELDWFPAVDIFDDLQEYVFQVDVPAAEPGDVQVTVEENGLVISGQRPEPWQEGKTPLRIERPHGHFERRFALPEDADRQKIASVFERGVLELHIRKLVPLRPVAAAPRLKLRSGG